MFWQDIFLTMEGNNGNIVSPSQSALLDQITALQNQIVLRDNEISKQNTTISNLVTTVAELNNNIKLLSAQVDTLLLEKNTIQSQTNTNTNNKRKSNTTKTSVSKKQCVTNQNNDNPGVNSTSASPNDNLVSNSIGIANNNTNNDTSPDAIDDMSTDDSNIDDCNWQHVSHKNKRINKTKIQPIQVDNVINISSLHKVLFDNIGMNKFTINQLGSGTSVRIYANTMETHKTIIDCLKDAKIEFHSYLHSDEKKHCLLLKGISGIQMSSIRDELVRTGLPENIEISEFTTGFQRQHPEIKHKEIFKLVFPPNTDLSILKHINSIFGFQVKFEQLKTNGITQCRNCQSYFHSAARCFKPYKCVKCINQHSPGACSLDTNDSNGAQPQCVNCNGYHTANDYEKCDYFKEKILPFVNRKSTDSTGQRKSTISSVQQKPNSTNMFSNKNSIMGSGKQGGNLIDAGGIIKNKSYADVVSKSNIGKSVKKNSISTANNASDSLNNNNEILSLLTKLLVNQDKLINHIINKK